MQEVAQLAMADGPCMFTLWSVFVFCVAFYCRALWLVFLNQVVRYAAVC